MSSKNIDDIIAQIDISSLSDSTIELPTYEESITVHNKKQRAILLNSLVVAIFATGLLAIVQTKFSFPTIVNYLLIALYGTSLIALSYVSIKSLKVFREEYTYTTIDFIRSERRAIIKVLRLMKQMRYYIYPATIIGTLIYFSQHTYQGLISIVFGMFAFALIFNFSFFYELSIHKQRKKLETLR